MVIAHSPMAGIKAQHYAATLPVGETWGSKGEGGAINSK
jgi:hypothetical protein